MILLFGGTSDSVDIARSLVDMGKQVLVSTATDEPMAIDDEPAILRRCGRLDENGMIELIREQAIVLVIDATHPYALSVRANARIAAEKTGVHYLRYTRPSSDLKHDSLRVVDSHDEAALSAFSFGKTVLLTTGANNLKTYKDQSRMAGVPLFARVLPRDESIQRCRDAGIPDENVIAAKGPFSVEATIDHIERTGAGVIVAKDSGMEGGLPERLEAAERTGCHMVIVRRPDPGPDDSFDYETLLAKVRQL